MRGLERASGTAAHVLKDTRSRSLLKVLFLLFYAVLRRGNTEEIQNNKIIKYLRRGGEEEDERASQGDLSSRGAFGERRVIAL